MKQVWIRLWRMFQVNSRHRPLTRLISRHQLLTLMLEWPLADHSVIVAPTIESLVQNGLTQPVLAATTHVVSFA